MKIIDILEAARGNCVLQDGHEYRVDPNPDHRGDRHPEAWTDDVSMAHVFNQKGARRFLQQRAELAKTSSIAHKDLKIVPVELDEHGRPFIPEVRRPSFFDRMREMRRGKVA